MSRSILVDSDDDEVDSHVFKVAAANDLTSVKDLETTLPKFGLSKDCRIDRRDMVLIYNTVEKDMEKEINSLAQSGDYHSAKDMRTRLNNLRQEFEDLQVSAVSTQRDDQWQLFGKASTLMKKQNADLRRNIDEETYNHRQRLLNDLDITQQIQTENLEKEIERMQKPVIKYSRHLIGLFKSEAALIKLCEYEEAKKVRTLIDKIRPAEEKRFWDAYDAKIQGKRNQLLASQRLDRDRLEEGLKGEFFNSERKKERAAQLVSMRIKTHCQDMEHAHALQTNLKPEMSVKPSALLYQREGFKATSAVLRGRQLLDHVHGKRAGESVHAEPLIGVHNFDRPLQDTMEY